jgi:hypothetical protein
MRRLLRELFEMGQNIDRCDADKVINRPECAVDSLIWKKRGLYWKGQQIWLFLKFLKIANRLQLKSDSIALLLSLSKILDSNAGIDPAAAKYKLHLLGWNSHLRKSIIDAILRAEGYRLWALQPITPDYCVRITPKI